VVFLRHRWSYDCQSSSSSSSSVSSLNLLVQFMEQANSRNSVEASSFEGEFWTRGGQSNPMFLKLEGWLPCSQQAVTGPSSEPGNGCHLFPSHFLHTFFFPPPPNLRLDLKLSVSVRSPVYTRCIFFSPGPFRYSGF